MIYMGIQAVERREKACEALAKDGLKGRQHHDPSELFDGQLQPAAIVRAIAGNPVVVLVGELKGNLGAKLSVEIMELFKELNERGHITIVTVTNEAANSGYSLAGSLTDFLGVKYRKEWARCIYRTSLQELKSKQFAFCA